MANMKYNIPTLIALSQEADVVCNWTDHARDCKLLRSGQGKKPIIREFCRPRTVKPVESSTPTKKLTPEAKLRGRLRPTVKAISTGTPTDVGFAQFLHKHTSPNHQRVTAGGKIVPMANFMRQSNEGNNRVPNGQPAVPATSSMNGMPARNTQNLGHNAGQAPFGAYLQQSQVPQQARATANQPAWPVQNGPLAAVPINQMPPVDAAPMGTSILATAPINQMAQVDAAPMGTSILATAPIIPYGPVMRAPIRSPGLPAFAVLPPSPGPYQSIQWGQVTVMAPVPLPYGPLTDRFASAVNDLPPSDQPLPVFLFRPGDRIPGLPRSLANRISASEAADYQYRLNQVMEVLAAGSMLDLDQYERHLRYLHYLVGFATEDDPVRQHLMMDLFRALAYNLHDATLFYRSRNLNLAYVPEGFTMLQWHTLAREYWLRVQDLTARALQHLQQSLNDQRVDMRLYAHAAEAFRSAAQRRAESAALDRQNDDGDNRGEVSNAANASNGSRTVSNASRNGSNASRIGSNASHTGSNASRIGSNASRIGSNASRIGSNASHTGSNASRNRSDAGDDDLVRRWAARFGQLDGAGDEGQRTIFRRLRRGARDDYEPIESRALSDPTTIESVGHFELTESSEEGDVKDWGEGSSSRGGYDVQIGGGQETLRRETSSRTSNAKGKASQRIKEPEDPETEYDADVDMPKDELRVKPTVHSDLLLWRLAGMKGPVPRATSTAAISKVHAFAEPFTYGPVHGPRGSTESQAHSAATAAAALSAAAESTPVDSSIAESTAAESNAAESNTADSTTAAGSST